ncbi:MAG: alpha-amylase family protein, partial [Bryobacteraceae bacterium]
SPYMPAGTDFFGAVLQEAHSRKIRVVGRFDLSKTQKAVYDAHPEWFFRRANGQPVVYNGLYSTCINGGYYRGAALAILTEALERYPVDALFFNMFGNPAADYSGNPLGLCHCDACSTRFRARYNRPLPETPDADYREFLETAKMDVAREIANLIHVKRPAAGLFTYIQEETDAITSESNTAVDRPLPLWPYSASDNVNRARNSQPDKMAFNLCIGFVDIPYRFATVPQPEIRGRLYQNMANGAGPAFVALGTLDQEDRSGIQAAREVFTFHARHEDLYVGQQSAARVLLVGGRGNGYRGFFRLLTEQHIPFAVLDNSSWIPDGAKRFDLVIAPEGTAKGIERYVQAGGRLLVAGTRPPPMFEGKSVHLWTDTRSSYLRVRDHALFPSLKNTDVLFLDGGFLEFPPESKPLLTLIPPAMFGPPEKVGLDRKLTDKPGVLLRDNVAYLPWDLGSLYYRHGSDAHAGLAADLIDHFLPQGRQLRTNAHPLVEITLMRQPAKHRTMVHLVNLSGHSQTSYFRPIEMRDINIDLAGTFTKARSVTLERELPITKLAGRTKITLPTLNEYDVVVLE